MSDREEFEKRLQVPEDAIWSEKEREAWAIGMNTRPPSAGVPDEWRDVVARTVQALSIMDESEGIAGWHLNGDVSPWDEGDLPALRDELTALLATPQPEGDGWVRCGERLPTEADEDFEGLVWLCWPHRDLVERVTRRTASFCEGFWWMPTGLKRPQPPKEGSGDE